MGRALEHSTQLSPLREICLLLSPLIVVIDCYGSSNAEHHSQNTKMDAKEGSGCLESAVDDGGPNVVEGRPVPGSIWAMLHIPFAWGTNRKSPGGWERVTILQHQHSLPQTPDFIILKFVYLFMLSFARLRSRFY